MKKIGKLLIILIGSIPLICNAQVEKEVNYKWYTLIEDNVHYESEADQICEYFDKSNYITSDWKYSIQKPEEKEYRTIKKEIQEIHIGREYFNTIEVREFLVNKDTIEVYELEILDKDNNPIEKNLANYSVGGIFDIIDGDKTSSGIMNHSSYLTFTFPELHSIKDIKIVMTYKDDEIDVRGISFNVLLDREVFLNAFSNIGMDVKTSCKDGICTQEMVVEDDFYNEDRIIPTYAYKYQDKSYKCYDLKKLYVPGYHKELEGYIKDEENFIEITKETKVETDINTKEETKPEVIDNKQEEIITNNKEENTDLKNEEIKDNIEDTLLKKPVAIVTKEETEETESITPYVICLVVLVIISILAYIIKKVVKSRTK